MNKQRTIVWIGGLAIAAGIARFALWPARIRNARVTAIEKSSQPSASLAWSYRSGGQRPISVIIDLATADGMNGSLTTDGEQINGAIPLSSIPEGDYTITTTATYRIAGVAQIIEQTFKSYFK